MSLFLSTSAPVLVVVLKYRAALCLLHCLCCALGPRLSTLSMFVAHGPPAEVLLRWVTCRIAVDATVLELKSRRDKCKCMAHALLAAYDMVLILHTTSSKTNRLRKYPNHIHTDTLTCANGYILEPWHMMSFRRMDSMCNHGAFSFFVCCVLMEI